MDADRDYDGEDLQIGSMTVTGLREEAAYRRSVAADLRAEEKRYKRMAFDEGRAADQRAWEAPLVDAAADALAAVEQARSLIPGLETDEEAAAAAVQSAADRRRKDAKGADRLARAEQRLADEGASIDQQAEAAVRAAKARQVAAKSAGDHDQAQGGHAGAVAAVAAQRAEAGRRETAYLAAVRAAQNPGEAPRSSGLPLGVAGASDLTGDERQLFVAMMAARAAATSADDHKAATDQDPGKVRFLRARGGSTVAVLPPAQGA
jgi:hypothetical protein